MKIRLMHGFISLSMAGAACVIAQQAAAQQNYPTRPVRLVVPFPAGGTADVLGRMMAQRLFTLAGGQALHGAYVIGTGSEDAHALGAAEFDTGQ